MELDGYGPQPIQMRTADAPAAAMNAACTPASKNFKNGLERRCAGLRNCVVLVARSAAYTDCPNHFAVLLKRNAACKNHDAAVVRCVNAEKLVARLGMGCEVFGRNVEGPGCVGF